MTRRFIWRCWASTSFLLVAIMIGLALFNHIRLLPRLTAGGAPTHLFRHIRWELVLGLVVVALAALLGLLPPTV